ncbi:MAG: GntR family transcriptional regulator [Propionibacteriaceae bacterium]
MSWDDEGLVIGTMPLWAQIADRLRAGIAKGEFVEGDVLPSEAQIMGRFEISRATARAGLNQLASEGLVERRSGKGTRVLPSKVELPLNLLSSFSEDMNSRGLKPGYGEVTITVEPLEGHVAEALETRTGVRAVRVERLLLANKKVIAHSTSWLSPAFIPASDAPNAQAITRGPLYQWLEVEHGFRVTHGTEVIEGGVADAELAERLGIAAGSAVLIANRTARIRDGKPIEYVERQYRADRYRYRIELVRP